MGTWHDPELGWPIAAPLKQCAELLGVDLATVRGLAAKIDPYLRADGTRIWSLTQLERQLRPRGVPPTPGSYLNRRQTSATDPAPIQATVGITHGQVKLARQIFRLQVGRPRGRVSWVEAPQTVKSSID